jgi:hypothetical protein
VSYLTQNDPTELADLHRCRPDLRVALEHVQVNDGSVYVFWRRAPDPSERQAIVGAVVKSGFGPRIKHFYAGRLERLRIKDVIGVREGGAA